MVFEQVQVIEHVICKGKCLQLVVLPHLSKYNGEVTWKGLKSSILRILQPLKVVDVAYKKVINNGE